jgi:hypothetical protein
VNPDPPGDAHVHIRVQTRKDHSAFICIV